MEKRRAALHRLREAFLALAGDEQKEHEEPTAAPGKKRKAGGLLTVDRAGKKKRRDDDDVVPTLIELPLEPAPSTTARTNGNHEREENAEEGKQGEREGEMQGGDSVFADVDAFDVPEFGYDDGAADEKDGEEAEDEEQEDDDLTAILNTEEGEDSADEELMALAMSNDVDADDGDATAEQSPDGEDDALFMDADAFERSMAADEDAQHAANVKKDKKRKQRHSNLRPITPPPVDAEDDEEPEQEPPPRKRTVKESRPLHVDEQKEQQEAAEAVEVQQGRKKKKIKIANPAALRGAEEAEQSVNRVHEQKGDVIRKHRRQHTSSADVTSDHDSHDGGPPSDDSADAAPAINGHAQGKAHGKKRKKKKADAQQQADGDAGVASSSIASPQQPSPSSRPSSCAASSSPLTVTSASTSPRALFSPASERTAKSVRISLEHNRTMEFYHYLKLDVKEHTAALLSKPAPKPAIKRRSLDAPSVSSPTAQPTKKRYTGRLSLPIMSSSVPKPSAVRNSLLLSSVSKPSSTPNKLLLTLGSPRKRPHAADFF